jgi:RNA polymerase sigma-70 factor, ECF subfamily
VSSSTARFYSRALGSEVVSATAEEVSRSSLHRPDGVPDAEVPFKEDSKDESLLARICDGDTEALASLFRRYARTVRAVALRILKDPSEADDLLQDIFVLIHRFAETFDNSKASVQFWIVQMTYRRAISRRQYLNSRHFYTQLELNDEVIQTTVSGVERQDASLDQRLAELDLEKMFSSLSEDQQKTLRMHFIEGYTLDEIAKMLGQTKGNIRHHSFRGLEKLRKLIFGGELSGTRAV